MKLKYSMIASRPAFIFIILAIGVLLLPCLVIPWWHNVTKDMNKKMDLNAHMLRSALLSEIESTAKILQHVNSSAINLARLMSSSINTSTGFSSYNVEKQVAPLLFHAFSIAPLISQISYIGLDGPFFSYYYEGNQTFAMYSNSTATSGLTSNKRNYIWYRQPTDSNTGKLYGEAIESHSFVVANESWVYQALNSSRGYASFRSGWNSGHDPLFLNTVGVNAKGVISLGFSVKTLMNFFNGIDLGGGSLYVVTNSGEVLIRGLHETKIVVTGNLASLYLIKQIGDHHVGNVSCRPNNSKLNASSVFEIWEAKYTVHCSPLEIMGLQLVYVLAIPYDDVPTSVNRNSKVYPILLIIMTVTIVISIFSFIFLTVRAAFREMRLCSALITQMEATQQAERKSMNKSLAFASASHDIRAALAGITGLIEMCYEEARPASELETNLQQMDGCTKDLVGLLNSILDTSKIEAGKMQLEEEEFDLAKLVEDVVDLFHPVGLKKGVDVVLDSYDGSILKYSRVKGDRGKLKQVLCNLLSNAVKFTSEGHVSVRAWAQKPSLESKIIASNQNGLWRHISCLFSKNKEEYNGLEAMNATKQNPNSMEFVFEVNDTGKGIPKEKQKSVFENFVQVKETALGQGGTGLGLGIVQSLVRLMGGEIGIVDKENNEKGTCFRFNVFLIATSETPSTDHNKNAEINQSGRDSVSDSANLYLGLTIKTPNPGLTSRTPSPRLSIFGSSPKSEGSHVVLLIENEERLRSSQKFMEGLGIKVSVVKHWEHLRCTLKKLNSKQINASPHSSSGKSADLGSRSNKEVILSSIDGIDLKPPVYRSSILKGAPSGFVLLVIDAGAGPLQELCRVVAEFKRDLHGSYCKVVWLGKPSPQPISHKSSEEDRIDPSDDILLKPFHGSRLYQVIRLLPEFGGTLSHGVLAKQKKESTIHAVKDLRDPGSSSTVFSHRTKSKIPSTYEDLNQQVDIRAEGSSTTGTYRGNSTLSDQHFSPAKSKSRQSPTEKLRIVSPEIQEVSGNKWRGKPLSGMKFLVADDNQVSRRITSHILKGHGASVEVCVNGEEALELVRMGLQSQGTHGDSILLPYDYILMDCEMPKMNGCEATRQIRKEERLYGVHIPIFSFSADNSGGEGKKMEEAGTDGQVDKRFKMEHLLETIGNVQRKRMHG